MGGGPRRHPVHPVAVNPYEVLGVDEGASVAELAAARRRLARVLHPDRGGDHAAMQALNVAYEEAVRRLGQPATNEVWAQEPTPPASPDPRPARRWRPQHGQRVAHDNASFTIDVLPAEAFEALLVVTSWIGEALVDDPPYVLEVFLHDPEPCWCRLDLVPDAGATTVSLTIAGVDGDPAPDLDLVRDTWVAGLNQPIW